MHSANGVIAVVRNVMLVVNPRSGKGISKAALGAIVSQLCGSGYAVTVYYVGDLGPDALAYEYAKYHDMAVCVGGDGTLSSVISGILRSGVSIPVGYIPAGTANDIAKTLSLSKKPSVALRTILNGNPRLIDIGVINGRYFTYISAFGAFTDVSYSTKQSAKRTLGRFAYILSGIGNVLSIKPRHIVVEYDGNVIEGEYVFGGVANSTSVAGFVKIDPKHVDLADGMFEVILVKNPLSLAGFVSVVSRILRKKYDGDSVAMLHASSVKFTFDEEVAWTVDGENGGLHKEVEITNRREAFSILV